MENQSLINSPQQKGRWKKGRWAEHWKTTLKPSFWALNPQGWKAQALNVLVEMQGWVLQVSFGNRSTCLKISTVAREQEMAVAEGRLDLTGAPGTPLGSGFWS